MPYGGVFVCCSDTLEVYNDSDIAWTFPATGITGLVHPSTLEIGTTHGVYLLDTAQSIVDGKLIYNTRKFLHKPSVIKMKATDDLVTEVGDGEGVYTDSAYFMSMDAALKVKNFYKKYKPLTCEIDAYGDILQSLGSESDDGYITNTANVVSTTGSLITVRKQVYDWMRNTPFHALALVPNHADTPGTSGVTSHFYHFGTTKEYLELLTEDIQLAEMFGKEVVNFCAGNPYKFLSRKSTEQHATEHVLPSNVQGHVNDSSLAIRLKSAPCIMSSVMLSGVEIGEGSVLEYCRLRECVSIGSCCVVSNCSFKPNAKVPPDTFMHTVSVTRSNTISLSPVGYVTVAFGIDDDLKFSSKTYEAGKNIKYFGKPLYKIFSDSGQAFAGFENKETVNLWKAKLFQIFDTAEESSAMMCEFLESLSQQNEDVHVLQHPDTNLLSMDDILKVKNVENMLHFRCALEDEIIHQCMKGSVNYH
ncbi:fucose-1-phosphate guanylyltransferase-like [Clavelina lepadiformis]|uniref:fucose-1-phosphate guanylyltransferase-like n=1 Tax=Clavelina lepadiformis TaxID=159417 RepID=UPI0040429474